MFRTSPGDHRFDTARTKPLTMRLGVIAKLMNGRPRETLGWKTPAEAMGLELAAEK